MLVYTIEEVLLNLIDEKYISLAYKQTQWMGDINLLTNLESVRVKLLKAASALWSGANLNNKMTRSSEAPYSLWYF